MSDFKTKYPLIAGIVETFSVGNDASTTTDLEYYFDALENSGADLDSIESEAATMEELEREVIIRGVLPAEASYIEYDEDTLSEKYPAVGSLYDILSAAATEYDGDQPR